MEESAERSTAHGAAHRTNGSVAAATPSSCTSESSWLFEPIYPAPKVVKIRDWKLASLRYSLRTIVFVYVMVYQMAYEGAHLVPVSVNGVVGTQMHHPTWNDCDEFKDLGCMQNFVGLSRLPYCKQNNYTGTYQKYCNYWDATQLMKPTDEGVLIPTRVLTYLQKRGCKPSFENNWECLGSMWDFVDADGNDQAGPDKVAPLEDVFIADVERYKILFDHSAHSDAGMSAYSFEMKGSWLNCSNPESKDEACKRSQLVEQRGACGGINELPSMQDSPLHKTQREVDRQAMVKLESQPVDTEIKLGDAQSPDSEGLGGWRWPSSPTVLSLCDGDVFSLGQLLTAANIGLDSREPSRTNQTYRATGFGLVVRILYSNVEPWMGLKVFPWNPLGPMVHYSYHIKKHASPHNNIRMTKHTSADRRSVQEFQGVTIITEQYGSILTWDTCHLLVILTTLLALITAANFMVEKTAVFCMTRSHEYQRLMYETPEHV